MDALWVWVEILRPIFILLGVNWLTYIGSLWCGYVSDDVDPGGGIAIHDGLVHVKGWPFGDKCPKCQLPPDPNADPHHPNPCGKTSPLSYGILFKQLRWYYGRVANSTFNKQLDPNNPQSIDSRPYVAHSVRHHRLNIFLFNGVSVSLYCLLSRLIGEPLAFYSTLLFSVHPLGVQVITWVSGVGYIVSIFMEILALNAAVYYPVGWVGLVLYGFFHLISTEAVFITCGTPAILAFLGLWPYAIVSLVISLRVCFKTFKESVLLRIKVFEEQQMGYSAKFHLKKIVVIGKVITYYTKLMLFPKRMGLYHKYGYHYDMPQIEEEDNYFWCGIGLFILSTVSFFLAPFPVKLGIVIIYTFLILFLDWIVVHQFVAERYCWISSLGMCLIASYYLKDYPYIFWSLFGIAIMRTWAHIPTYDNEIKFYESNIWNFPDSEVAMGNLGVIQIKQGFTGSAIETWMRGATINPNYDVNWYNLYSITKSQGQIAQSRQFLVNAIRAKTCHFPKAWRDELKDIDEFMIYSQKFGHIQNYLNQIRSDPTKSEVVKDLSQAIDHINSIGQILEAEKARENQGLALKIEEINRSFTQLGLMQKEILDKKKQLKEVPSGQDIMNKQRQSIDAVLDKIAKDTGRPIMIQMPPPLEGSPQKAQQVFTPQPRVLDVNAVGELKNNPEPYNPKQDKGQSEPPQTS